jgi:hypothetical protein
MDAPGTHPPGQSPEQATNTPSSTSSGSSQRQASSGFYSLNRWLGETRREEPWSQPTTGRPVLQSDNQKCQKYAVKHKD